LPVFRLLSPNPLNPLWYILRKPVKKDNIMEKWKR
jgi:hypothetical protein